jgi:hypothetical protein
MAIKRAPGIAAATCGASRRTNQSREGAKTTVGAVINGTDDIKLISASSRDASIKCFFSIFSNSLETASPRFSRPAGMARNAAT